MHFTRIPSHNKVDSLKQKKSLSLSLSSIFCSFNFADIYNLFSLRNFFQKFCFQKPDFRGTSTYPSDWLKEKHEGWWGSETPRTLTHCCGSVDWCCSLEEKTGGWHNCTYECPTPTTPFLGIFPIEMHIKLTEGVYKNVSWHLLHYWWEYKLVQPL